MYDPDLSRNTRPKLPGHKELQLILGEDALHTRMLCDLWWRPLCLVRLSHSHHYFLSEHRYTPIERSLMLFTLIKKGNHRMSDHSCNTALNKT